MIILILYLSVFLNVGLLAILALLALWNTTKKQGGSNHLSTLKKMESEVMERQTSQMTLTTEVILDDFNTTTPKETHHV
ncbi:hypothetical phage protein [Salmonella phage Vi06]|uniref:Hypothetical phage protein n=1 Tax=Salmonella phage Vi06 TaxID=866889 RepID=E1XU98_9CAUD|nr:hypothetical protein Vi06_19 [Salmonella phage Vi06]CBV65217.1 hypothetical phage protein [Salmonella phage Vi06]